MKKNYLFCVFYALLLLSFLLIGTGAAAQTNSLIPATEKQALVDLYNSTNGDNWLEDFRWDLNVSPSQWWGVLIEDGHVKGLSLRGFNLTGTLPDSFFNDLPYLTILELSGNFLSGEIPAAFNNLTQLEFLSLGDNRWTGKLPPLDKLSKLKVLRLSQLLTLNRDGSIASVVDAMLPDLSVYPDLEEFDGSFSAFKGTITTRIGECTKLKILDLTANLLEGSLPVELNKCSDLRVLSVQLNRLSGSIPDLSALQKLGEAGPDDVGRLYLNQNKFTGEFPLWVTKLKRLSRFSCSDNQLSGPFPSDLSGMVALEALFADKNSFEGTLPEMLPPALEWIDLSKNNFTGTIPLAWENAAKLNKLRLAHNNLSGSTPAIFKKADQLDYLLIAGNRFSFADYESWLPFMKDADCSFIFGGQQPYTPDERKNLSHGENCILDATYPGTLLGDETYQWYNATTGELLPGETKPQLLLKGVTMDQAYEYVCMVQSPRFVVPETEAMRSLAEDEDTIQPFLISGKIVVYVDGKSHVGIHQPSNKATLKVYPTTLRSGGLLHIASDERIEEAQLYDAAGRWVGSQSVDTSHVLELPTLAPGNYIIWLKTVRNQSYHRLITIVP